MTEEKPKRRRSRRKASTTPLTQAPEAIPEAVQLPTIHKVSLNDALRLTGDVFRVSPLALQKQAEQTPYTDVGFPTPTLSLAERRFLYALIRVVQPYRIVEFGTGWGASMTSIAAAAHNNLRNSRKEYHVTSVDIRDKIEGTRPIGANIPAELRPKINFVTTDAVIWLHQQPSRELDFIFEDAGHSYDLTRDIYSLAVLDRLRRGGFIISHDACHDSDSIGEPIRRAIESVGIEPLYLKIDGSRHGLSVWRVR